MKAWLIDTYRNHDKIAIWLKVKSDDDSHWDNIRIKTTYTTTIYALYSTALEKYLKQKHIKYQIEHRSNYKGDSLKVFSFKISRLTKYESVVRKLERITKHKLRLYNADIPPEQMYLFKKDLKPCSLVNLELNEDNSISSITMLNDTDVPPLTGMKIDLLIEGSIKKDFYNARLKAISVDGNILEGNEPEQLMKLAELFRVVDPDVIMMQRAFTSLPFLISRLNHYGIQLNFHRFDPVPLKSKGGKSFFSYGNIVYRDYAIRLHGRLLVDTTTMIGSDCHVEGIAELCQLSGARFQHIASRSFGATFQLALVREMVRRNILIPFKEKPVDLPLTMFDMMKGDRVGHTLDPIVGFHTDVAELDFSSMYPWIIYHHNISTETLASNEPPFEQVPGLPLKISAARKGIVPISIHPFLERRMFYKNNPSPLNKKKAQGLKWVLVTSYGYLRFREFKLGNASSHMAIGAFAREALLKAVNIAEEHGFEVLHGIIDSIYIKKKGITEAEVRELCREIELTVGIPLGFEGTFKWIVFLPSIADPKRPVPTHYYGAFINGEIKARGIELRVKSTPLIVKLFQDRILKDMALQDSEHGIKERIPIYARYLRESLADLSPQEGSKRAAVDPRLLIIPLTISRTEYKHNIPQKRALDKLKAKGISLMPGQKVRFIYSESGIVLPEDYDGRPDIDEYKKLLSRSLYMLLEPFIESRYDLYRLLEKDRQTYIFEYLKAGALKSVFSDVMDKDAITCPIPV